MSASCLGEEEGIIGQDQGHPRELGAGRRTGVLYAGQGFPLGARSGEQQGGSPAAHTLSCLPRFLGAGSGAAPAGASGVRAAPAPRAPALPLGADPQPRGRETPGGRGSAPEAVQAAGQCGCGGGGGNPKPRTDSQDRGLE